MADRLVVMTEGRVAQVGSQRDLYERPADRFVAGFVGRSTFIDGQIVEPGRMRTEGGLELRCTGGAPGRATLALRPERVAIAREPIPGIENCLPGAVEFVSYLGSSIDVHIRLSPAERVIAQIPNRAGGFLPEIGDKVHAGWSADAATVFAGSTVGAS